MIHRNIIKTIITSMFLRERLIFQGEKAILEIVKIIETHDAKKLKVSLSVTY